MKHISSDTNVWKDFEAIHREALPFRASYVYIMYEEQIQRELIKPPDLGRRLVELGLQSVSITTYEFDLADLDYSKYSRLSQFDRIALAIAKNRNITLLTGDKYLRDAAFAEGVSVLGTIGLLKELYTQRLVSVDEYRFCLQELIKCVREGSRRLPISELEKLLRQIAVP